MTHARVVSVTAALLLACGGDDAASVDATTETTTSATSSSEATTAGDTTSSPEPATGTGSGGPGSTGDDSTGGSDGSGGSEETGSGPPMTCAVVDIDGECIDVATCGEGSTAFGGICDGVPSSQCCVGATPPCSVSGAPGLCMDVADCGAPFVATAGLCPGDANVQCCTDPATACDEMAMPTPNDGLVEESWDATCPDGMVRSADICIDRYEASLVQLDAGGNEVGSWSPYFNPGSTRVRAVSLRGAVPQGYINETQAAAACAEAGKRMCTDAEWLRACQGSGTTTYPYGEGLMPGVCNDARANHPAIEYFGTADAWIWSELGNPCISQIPASLDITGVNAGCESEDGALDMMGNLHEWTADPAGTFRGGFYADTMINGPGCLYATTAHDVSHWDYSTGFRCCADG